MADPILLTDTPTPQNLFHVDEQYHYYLPSCCECLNETSRTGSINAAPCTAQYSMTDFWNYKKKKKIDSKFSKPRRKISKYDCRH